MTEKKMYDVLLAMYLFYSNVLVRIYEFKI